MRATHTHKTDSALRSWHARAVRATAAGNTEFLAGMEVCAEHATPIRSEFQPPARPLLQFDATRRNKDNTDNGPQSGDHTLQPQRHRALAGQQINTQGGASCASLRQAPAGGRTATHSGLEYLGLAIGLAPAYSCVCDIQLKMATALMLVSVRPCALCCFMPETMRYRTHAWRSS